MARFLIEVPHEANGVACRQAREVFSRTGSHFMTHADFDAPVAGRGASPAWST
jgi:hypothetical protein